MYRTAFLMLLAWTLGYILVKRRRIDLFTISTFGAVLYFMPAILGFARVWVPDGRTRGTLDEGSYVVMCVVTFAMWSGMCIYDIWLRRSPKKVNRGSRWASYGLLMVCWIAFVSFAADLGSDLFSSSKRVIYAERNTSLYNIALYLAFALTVYGTTIKSKAVVIGSSIVLAADSLLVMNRTFLVLGGVAASVVYLHRLGPVRLVAKWRWLIGGVACVWIVMAYHHVKEPLKQFDFREVATVLTRPGYIGYALLSSEPFTNQAILSAVVREDLEIPEGEYLTSWLVGIPFVNEVSGGLPRFSDRFQPALFANADETGAMAQNFWAQAWAASGIWSLAAVCIFYVACLIGLNRLLNSRQPVVLSFAATVGLWVAFYVHRNDVVGMMVSARRIVVVFGVLWVLSKLLDGMRPCHRSGQDVKRSTAALSPSRLS